MDEWIKNLKPGDEVIICGRYTKSIETIEKITPTGRIKAGNIMFSKDGVEIRSNPSFYGKKRLAEATPEDVREIKITEETEEAMRRMRQCAEITYEQAVEINKILRSDDAN